MSQKMKNRPIRRKDGLRDNLPQKIAGISEYATEWRLTNTVVNYFFISRILPSKASPVRKVWRFASKLR